MDKRRYEELSKMIDSLGNGGTLLTLFAQNLPGAAWAKDLFGVYAWVSSDFQRCFGLLEDPVGKTDEGIFGAQYARVFVEGDAYVKGHNSTLEQVESVPDADGKEQNWLVRKFPIYDRDNALRYVGGLAIDMSNVCEESRTGGHCPFISHFSSHRGTPDG